MQSPDVVGEHEWSLCATEGSPCACNGEIKIGNKDMEAFSHAVPVPNELDQQPDVKCELSELQYIAVHDPVIIAPREDPSYRECQCRGGANMMHAEMFGFITEPTKESISGMVAGGVVILGVMGYGMYRIYKKAKEEKELAALTRKKDKQIKEKSTAEQDAVQSAQGAQNQEKIAEEAKGKQKDAEDELALTKIRAEAAAKEAQEKSEADIKSAKSQVKVADEAAKRETTSNQEKADTALQLIKQEEAAKVAQAKQAEEIAVNKVNMRGDAEIAAAKEEQRQTQARIDKSKSSAAELEQEQAGFVRKLKAEEEAMASLKATPLPTLDELDPEGKSFVAPDAQSMFKAQQDKETPAVEPVKEAAGGGEQQVQNKPVKGEEVAGGEQQVPVKDAGAQKQDPEGTKAPGMQYMAMSDENLAESNFEDDLEDGYSYEGVTF